MARVGRPGMSDAAKRELWDRCARGESISEIARALAKPTWSVFTVLKSNGGYVPPVRTRRAGTLTDADREEISRGLGPRHGTSPAQDRDRSYRTPRLLRRPEYTRLSGPGPRVSPRPGHIQLTINQRASCRGHIRHKHPQLAVANLARRAGVLTLHPSRRAPFLTNPVSSATSTPPGSPSQSTP